MTIRSFIGLLISLLFLNCGFADAGGPWKGKVIDSETKEPIEGAAVLAVWERVYRTPAGDNSYFYEAKETLTDKNGFFEISSYTPINLLPIISYIDGPELTIFKPGYGSFPAYRVSPEFIPGDFFERETPGVIEQRYPGERNARGVRMKSDLWEKIPIKMGLVELPKFKTKEEKLKYLPSLPMYRESHKKAKNYMHLLNIERKELGLGKEGKEK